MYENLEPYPKETVEHILKRKMDELDLVTGDIAEYTNKKFIDLDEDVSITAESVGMLINGTSDDNRLIYERQYIPEILKLSDVEIEKWLNRSLKGFPHIPDDALLQLKKCVEHQMLPLKKDRDSFVDERTLRDIFTTHLKDKVSYSGGAYRLLGDKIGLDEYDLEAFATLEFNGKVVPRNFALNDKTIAIAKYLEFDDKEFEKWILINLDFMDVPKRFYGNFIRCIERRMNEVGIEE